MRIYFTHFFFYFYQMFWSGSQQSKVNKNFGQDRIRDGMPADSGDAVLDKHLPTPTA